MSLLKWVGGKGKLLSKINDLFPKEIDNYYEIFLGGGSVLIHILEENKKDKIKIKNEIKVYDINESLINFFNNVKNNPVELFNIVDEIHNKYKNCGEQTINRFCKTEDQALCNKENYYYWIRNLYNKTDKNTIENAAYFIFLNKTCFRGLYREGPNGFNVPYGNYKNPTILKLEDLLYISNLIQNVDFNVLDYKKSLTEIKNNKNNFVFIDPPYIKDNQKTFVSYNKKGFSLNDTEYLIKHIKNKDYKFILCNYESNKLKNEFINNSYNIRLIECNRYINSKNPADKETEIFIYNYEN